MKFNRRPIQTCNFLLLCQLWTNVVAAQLETEQQDGWPLFDVVVEGGRVMDPESGLDSTTNVGIRDGVILAVSDQYLEGETTINAGGLVVAPGFIDLDTFTRLARFQVADGVTTVFDIREGTADVDGWYADHVGKMPINYGVGVGYRWVRHRVMEPTPPFETDIPASDAQLQEILRGIQKGLDEGAVAIGMGPGRHEYYYWELLQTLRVAARQGVPVVAPMRDAIWSKSDLPANLSELMGAAALTGASVHISYLTSSGGPHSPRLLRMIGLARERGLDITVEDYPYRGAVARLDPDVDELRAMNEEELSDVFLVPAGRTMVREDIERYRGQRASIVYLNSFMEPYVAESVSSPLVSIASHGFLDDQLRGHPRTSGTYSRMLGRYVREQGMLTLMEALRKMSLMPAQRLQDWVPAMRRKGRIQAGADADLVIFNADLIGDRASYEEPTRPPEGISHVLVGGVAVVKDGELLRDVHPGIPVRAPIQKRAQPEDVHQD